jgi:hypothetical protein
MSRKVVLIPPKTPGIIRIIGIRYPDQKLAVCRDSLLQEITRQSLYTTKDKTLDKETLVLQILLDNNLPGNYLLP